MKLGSSMPSAVLPDVASFMDIEDAVKLSLASPRANYVISNSRAIVRPFEEMEISLNQIKAEELRVKRSCWTSYPLDKNAELAYKQVLRFLRTVSEAEWINWHNFDIDDKICNALMKINILNGYNKMTISYGRLTASAGTFRSLLTRHHKTVSIFDTFVSPSLFDNKTLALLGHENNIIPPNFGSADFETTSITDECLENQMIREEIFDMRDFLNIYLTFPAIRKFFQDIFASGNVSIYHKDYPRFGISLKRNVEGVVENAVIPEEFVDEHTVEDFKGLVQDLNSSTPIESVVQNKISLNYLRLHFRECLAQKYLEMETDIKHIVNLRNQTSQDVRIITTNLDQSSFEDIITKIMRTSSSMSSLNIFAHKLGETRYSHSMIKLTDRLFSNLLEHAADTVIENEWSMDIQLSPENLARLQENRAAGLFQNLKLGQLKLPGWFSEVIAVRLE